MKLARYAVRRAGTGLTDEEKLVVKRALLDTVGVGVAAWRLPSAKILWKMIESQLSPGRSRILGRGDSVGSLTAALMNGLLCHAQLYDDNNDLLIGHPSAPLVAVLLTIGPQVDADADRLLRAYGAGFDVSVRLGRLLNPAHYNRGWHATATLGIFGATATASILLGCSVNQVASALGIAASFASGVRENFGSMAMGLHVGNAAHGAVMAALLAKDGFTASPMALEGKYGFLATHDSPLDPGVEVDAEISELSASGIQFKLYPSGAPTLCAVEAALELVGQFSGPIDAVSCWVDPWYCKTLKEDDPVDPYLAKVNLKYCVAAALVNGRLTLEEFEPEALRDPDVRALINRMSVHVDESLADRGNFPARLLVRCGNRSEQASRLYPLGSPQRPATNEDIITKFIGCVGVASVRESPRKVASRFLALEELPTDALYDTLAASFVAPALGDHLNL